MKALAFDKSGIQNLKFVDYPDPEIKSNEVLIRVRMAGVNPIDYYTVEKLKVKPIPHIPGVEFSGEVVKVGEQVSSVNVGDRVTVYGKIFDGTCDMCMAGYETVCRNGGRIGVDTNGGWAEYIAVEEKYVFKLPKEYSWELGSSLSLPALTAYHALKEAELKPFSVFNYFSLFLLIFNHFPQLQLLSLSFREALLISLDIPLADKLCTFS